jgi:cytochrome b pre-mRNA-processing protein 3
MRDVATMNRKAQAWLHTLLGWGRRRQSGNAEKLYAETIRLARRPEFFEKYGVADDVDGRFDALSLIVILVLRRLKSLDEGGKALSQRLFDSMFADMDLSLREMGAGDIGVSKRVRLMAEAFMGRLDAYVTAIDNNDKDAFSAALVRNLFRGNKTIDPIANGLVDYLLDLSKEIDAIPAQALLAGKIAVAE